jgi:hypothetical protein
LEKEGVAVFIGAGGAIPNLKELEFRVFDN